MATVSVIKLIRTDTTLDLSQEAEKVWEILLPLPKIFIDSENFKTLWYFFDTMVIFWNFYSSRPRKLEKNWYTIVSMTPAIER